MLVGPSVDQLRVHPDFAASALDTSFQYLSDPELVSNFAQVPCTACFVENDGSATDHFEISDFGQIG